MIIKRLLLPGVLVAILALLALNLTTSPSRAAPPARMIDLVGTYDGVAQEVGNDESYKESFFSMEIMWQEGHLFYGVMDSGFPITGAIMSLEGSATTLVMRMSGGDPQLGGVTLSGSATVVSGKGNKPDQVILEMLAAGLQSGERWNWSGYAKAVKRPKADVVYPAK